MARSTDRADKMGTEKDKMKVDIYVQKDRSALVVEAGCAVGNLSDEGQRLVKNAVNTKKNYDIDSSIIGLDRDRAKSMIAENGEFVNHATVRTSESMRKYKNGLISFAAFITSLINTTVLADTLIISDSPSVVRNAEIREAIRQDSTWTSENISKNPYLFLQDQISNCDKLKAKIEAQNITLVRMEKKALRDAEEAGGAEARYSNFLTDAKAAYKAADGKFPVSVNGYEMDEEELNEKIDDAMTRVEIAKKEKRDNQAIAKKVGIRKGVLKKKKQELTSLRMKLVQQAEQVKMNAALSEIGSLKDMLGTIQDMMIEIDEDPTKLSVKDMTEENPNAKRNRKVNSFLKD